MMNNVVLKTIDLTKLFRGVTALDHVALNVREGEVFGFLGPNGAGKTTTIGMMLGLVRPTEGMVEIFGEKVLPQNNFVLREVGALVGAPGLIPTLSGRENLSILARIPPQVDGHRIDEVLDDVDLVTTADKPYRTYSTGMKQRLGLAAALLHRPKLLILDEPTNGLDPAGMKDVRDLIRRQANLGTTIFLSSHLLHEVEQVCNQVAILNQGQIVVQGNINDLLNKQSRLVSLLVDVPDKAGKILQTLPAVKKVFRNGDFLCVEGASCEMVFAHLAPHGIVPREVRYSEKDLESVFLELTQTKG